MTLLFSFLVGAAVGAAAEFALRYSASPPSRKSGSAAGVRRRSSRGKRLPNSPSHVRVLTPPLYAPNRREVIARAVFGADDYEFHWPVVQSETRERYLRLADEILAALKEADGAA